MNNILALIHEVCRVIHFIITLYIIFFIGYYSLSSHQMGGFYLFSIGFSEIILILVIAYVFIGPQDLPKVARWLGRLMKRIRLLMSEIKTQSGWDDLLKETEGVQREITETIKENQELVRKSISGVENELKEVHQELNQNIEEAKKETLRQNKEV